jgi:hypothetical protein
MKNIKFNANVTTQGNLNVQGNLNIQGTTNVVDQNKLVVKDNIIVTNYGHGYGYGYAKDTGIVTVTGYEVSGIPASYWMQWRNDTIPDSGRVQSTTHWAGREIAVDITYGGTNYALLTIDGLGTGADGKYHFGIYLRSADHSTNVVQLLDMTADGAAQWSSTVNNDNQFNLNAPILMDDSTIDYPILEMIMQSFDTSSLAMEQYQEAYAAPMYKADKGELQIGRGYIRTNSTNPDDPDVIFYFGGNENQSILTRSSSEELPNNTILKWNSNLNKMEKSSLTDRDGILEYKPDAALPIVRVTGSNNTVQLNGNNGYLQAMNKAGTKITGYGIDNITKTVYSSDYITSNTYTYTLPDKSGTLATREWVNEQGSGGGSSKLYKHTAYLNKDDLQIGISFISRSNTPINTVLDFCYNFTGATFTNGTRKKEALIEGGTTYTAEHPIIYATATGEFLVDYAYCDDPVMGGPGGFVHYDDVSGATVTDYVSEL